MKRTLQYPKKIVDIYFLEMNNRHTFENAFYLFNNESLAVCYNSKQNTRNVKIIITCFIVNLRKLLSHVNITDIT